MSNPPPTLLHDQYHTALVSNVSPPGWVNPKPSGRYDLVIIGAGPAGLAAASRGAADGAKVALIEEKLIGGTSLNAGSVPTTCLLRSARAYADVYKSARFGIRLCKEIQEDFPTVMTRLRQVRSYMGLRDSARHFSEMGVDVYLGRGVFTGPRTVAVGGQTLRFAKAMIATGSRPVVPPVEGIDRTGYLTSETVFDLDQQPRHLALIGAGSLGCEMAQAFCRLGSEVTLIEREDRILPGCDPDAARMLTDSLQHEDVRVLTGATISYVREVDGRKMVHVRHKDQMHAIAVDQILIAAGRAPAVDGLNLAAANVLYDVFRGILVDDYLRTSNHNIVAAGDVCTHHQHTHAAQATARLALHNALSHGRLARVSRLVIPSCTYTDPEVAQVGLNCRQAQDRGIEMDTYAVPFHMVDRAIIDGDVVELLKVHTYKGTDRIAGAIIIASHATEMIGEIAMAMTHGIGLCRLGEVVHPYPTRAEAIGKASEACRHALKKSSIRQRIEHLLKRR